MAKAKVYTLQGTSSQAITLPKDFSEKENLPLLAQAVRVYESGKHQGTSMVKTRAEVNISKRKIYRQKHTGRARHGAKSAPIFIGGGVTHGPRGLKRDLVLPTNMRRKAKAVALSLKVKKGRLVVAKLAKIQKTKEADNMLTKIYLKEGLKKDANSTLFISDKNLGVRKYFRNIQRVNIVLYKDANAYDVFFGGLIILDDEIFEKKKAVKK